MVNEKRLIYADEAIELINGLESLPWEEETEYLVNSLTTVDAVEVVHGYVLPAEEPKKVLLDMKCGICDQLMLSTDAYCPMCGAKMDRGNEDGK